MCEQNEASKLNKYNNKCIFELIVCWLYFLKEIKLSHSLMPFKFTIFKSNQNHMKLEPSFALTKTKLSIRFKFI